MDKKRIPKLSALEKPLLIELRGAVYALSIVSDPSLLQHATVFCGDKLDASGKPIDDKTEEIMIKFFSPASEEMAVHSLGILQRYLSSKLSYCKWIERAKHTNPLFPEEGPVHFIARNRYAGINVLDFFRTARLESRSYAYGSLLDYCIETVSMFKDLHAVDSDCPGIVHRDIKPSNILLLEAQKPKTAIIDFDLACLVGETSSFATNRSYHGTNVYLAPEYFFPQKAPLDIDPSCDIYSLGIIIYETLEGCWPYFVPPERLRDQLFWTDLFKRGSIRQPQRIDEGLKALVMGMLDYDWKARPTAAQIEDYLISYKAGLDDEQIRKSCLLSHTSPDPTPTPLPC